MKFGDLVRFYYYGFVEDYWPFGGYSFLRILPEQPTQTGPRTWIDAFDITRPWNNNTVPVTSTWPI